MMRLAKTLKEFSLMNGLLFFPTKRNDLGCLTRDNSICLTISGVSGISNCL